jgi:SAM-dependent methyltransferase
MNIAVFMEEVSRGTLRDPLQHLRKRQRRTCTVCDFTGYFLSAGVRQEARCPNCASKERDRVIALHMKTNGVRVAGKRILHFSAERPFFRQWKRLDGYVAGDVKRSAVANAVVDITKIQFPDDTFDLVVCNHVLEHVPDDRTAVRELFRVLKPKGMAYISVPQTNKHQTWEPPADMPKEEVEKICGWDHVRFYGLDFPERLAAAGFEAAKIEYTPDEDTRHRLNAGGVDNVYVATKSTAT